MSLRPKKREVFKSWPAPSAEESKELRRKQLLRRSKYISQWTPAERRDGLAQMVGLAADSRARRYIKRNGLTYELIEMYDGNKKHAFKDAKEWRMSWPNHKVMVMGFGGHQWGLYVHSEEE